MVFNVILIILLLLLIVIAIDMQFFNETIIGTLAANLIKLNREYYMPKRNEYDPDFNTKTDYYYVVPRKFIKGRKNRGVYVEIDINDANGDNMNQCSYQNAMYYETKPKKLIVKTNVFISSFKKLKNK